VFLVLLLAHLLPFTVQRVAVSTVKESSMQGPCLIEFKLVSIPAHGAFSLVSVHAIALGIPLFGVQEVFVIP
jgi:hypothetical protein